MPTRHLPRRCHSPPWLSQAALGAHRADRIATGKRCRRSAWVGPGRDFAELTWRISRTWYFDPRKQGVIDHKGIIRHVIRTVGRLASRQSRPMSEMSRSVQAVGRAGHGPCGAWGVPRAGRPCAGGPSLRGGAVRGRWARGARSPRPISGREVAGEWRKPAVPPGSARPAATRQRRRGG
jgi:hypothetical protein